MSGNFFQSAAFTTFDYPFPKNEPVFPVGTLHFGQGKPEFCQGNVREFDFLDFVATLIIHATST